MEKYLVGSKLLGLNNRDEDYIAITDLSEEFKRVVIDNKDVSLRPLSAVKKSTCFDKEVDIKYKLWNYQLDKDIIGQDFPYEYHILDYKEELKALLKEIVSRNMYGFNPRVKCRNKETNEYVCSKIFYHIAYNLFILENNSPIITDEQKEIISKIHDGKMSANYIDELRERILLL